MTVPAILGLIYLGSNVVFFAFFQLTTIGYLISYFIPIALIFFRGRHLLPPAYWRMPDGLARFCNIVALLYIPFICVLFCIPNFYPVTSTNMNCERDLPSLPFLKLTLVLSADTSAIAAVAILIGTIGWYVEVRRHYKGPASQAPHLEETIAAV